MAGAPASAMNSSGNLVGDVKSELVSGINSFISALSEGSVDSLGGDPARIGSSHSIHHVHEHHNDDAHEMMTVNEHSGHMMTEGHMMKMWFHGGCNEIILFEFWRIESYSG
ncbi:hypothetical protein AB6A40_011339 [Gnathostoma spinigerum]|uniref:Uncharacterized protein n=1 Tax=Gnathostoma spinigerum TaxID=75299 RepID=A0ABD6F4K4_9BILA